jgi:dTDP-4-amino-4,6-dideoxygalactose transaminase
MDDHPVLLADPGLGDEERAAVDRVMRSGWITLGDETTAFEAEFAAALGTRSAVAVSSGTAALHLALLGLGIGPGDEVVVPSLTFVATAAAVLMTGADPVFVDVIGPEDLTLDPAEVAASVGPRTAAVIAVHYGGWAARCRELRAVVDDAGIALVEDTAHAPPTPGPDGVLGTIGHAGCFSFHATKNMTAGEGGMVVARSPEVLDRVRALRSHGMTAASWDRRWGRAARYDVPELGYNYRPTDLGSAIGRVQLARLDHERALRRDLTATYRRLLAPLPAALPFSAAAPSAHHLLPILLPAGADRDRIQAELRGSGIHTGVHFPPVHQFSAYRRFRRDPSRLQRTEALAPRLLSLPLHGRMSGADVERVVAALAAALAAAPATPGRRMVKEGVTGGR